MAKSRRYKQGHVDTVDVMTLVELGPDIQVGFDVAKTNQVASFQDRTNHVLLARAKCREPEPGKM